MNSNPQYHGKDVTIVRNVKQGDVGYDAASPQLIIKLPDGTTQNALQSEVTNHNALSQHRS